MTDVLNSGFRLGPFDVVPEQNTIAGPDAVTHIEPKAMAVLVRLAQGDGHTVPREELIGAVWPRGFVTDDSLTRCIAQLRKALGDDARTPRYLKTIPKLGYRLIQPAQRDKSIPAPPDATSEEFPRLIVLPLQNLSRNPDDIYIADGISELLTARLAAWRDIRVISHTTAMSFKDSGQGVTAIAAVVNADWAIEGSVLISGNKIQVVIQLIDPLRDAHAWARSYLRDITDLLFLQNEIANHVAAEISTEIGAGKHKPAPPAHSIGLKALRLYAQGRHLVSRRTVDSLHKAVAQFAQVTKLEPEFADAWSGQAEASMLLMHYGAESPEPSLRNIHTLLSRALELDPESAVALSCRGALRLFFELDIGGAMADCRQALLNQPNYTLAMLSLANASTVCGNFTEAKSWMQLALDVDPLDVGINMNLADHLIMHRQYEDGVKQLRRSLDLAEEHWPSRLRLAWALALSGENSAARRELKSAREKVGENAAYLEYAAMIAGLRGDPERARTELQKLETVASQDFVAPWALARAAAATGDIDVALHHLEKARQARSSSLIFFGVTPAFDELREHPKGQALLHSLGLSRVTSQ